jgi:hypothetical protein
VLFVLGMVVLGAIWLLFNLLVIAPLYVAERAWRRWCMMR